MKKSDYVKIVVTVPETHADQMRETLGRAGAGESEDYAYASFSMKGIGRFVPKKGSHPFIGKEGVMESVPEELIETICRLDRLERIVEEIKKAHPYEETVIDIIPIYEIGYKKS